MAPLPSPYQLALLGYAVVCTDYTGLGVATVASVIPSLMDISPVLFKQMNLFSLDTSGRDDFSAAFGRLLRHSFV